MFRDLLQIAGFLVFRSSLQLEMSIADVLIDALGFDFVIVRDEKQFTS